MPIYPHVEVKLAEKNGDALAIMARVAKALRKGGVDNAVIDTVIREALSGSYSNVLDTCVKYVKVS